MTLSISPAAAPVGATVRVSGEGLNPRGRVSPDVYVNLVSPGGALAMPAAPASAVRTTANGSLAASFIVPKAAGGQQSICIVGQVGPSGQGSICAPFTVLGGDAAPAADSATPRGSTASTQCYSCQVISNDAARRWGVYNSGTGKYEYHGAQPQH